MSELFIVKWPINISSTYIHGATLRYSKNKSVYYSNEVLSPGQVICSWHSVTDYLLMGAVPELPLLKQGREYYIKIFLDADNKLPVQININFFDHNKDNIESFSSTDFNFNFIVPVGTVSYDVNLINLKHQWIKFDYLLISDMDNTELVVDKVFRKNYECIYPHKFIDSKSTDATLIVSKGPKNITSSNIDIYDTTDHIFIYTNGEDIDNLVTDLKLIFNVHKYNNLTLQPSLEFYALPHNFIKKLKKELTPQAEIGKVKND